MAAYLKNNPVALRHCLLYEYLQRNACKRAFTNFRDTIGSDVFTEKEFRSYFSQFRKRKIEGYSRPITDMRDVLRDDEHALRACILYEYLKYKLAGSGYSTYRLWPRTSMELDESRLNSSFVLHQNFCNTLGENVMGYPEFDFWFRRFVNGEFDLSYKMDTDMKMLTDMPIDVLKNIVGYLHLFDRVSLAQTSRSFETFVEDQKIFHQRIEFRIDDQSASISWENRNENLNGCRKFTKRSGNSNLIRGVPYWKQGIQEWKRILKFSELHSEEFCLDLFGCQESRKDRFKFFDEVIDCLGVALKSIRQVHAKTLSFHAYSMKPLLNILPCLKPGYLSKIDLDVPADLCLCGIEKFEQWKQAKCFKMVHKLYVAPLFHLFHFKEFHVSYRTLTVEDIRQIKEILFNSPCFEYCTIRATGFNPFDMNVIRNQFRDAIQGRPNTMAEFLKNNPTALRHCVLYVFLQKKSVEKAFDDFCETVGADIIKKEEFQYWFDQFKQVKFDDKEKSISDMREIIRSDKQALCSCVMYEWLKTKNLQLELMMDNLCRENKALPVFAKYQNFCKVIGDDVMEYREFEFWFHRFFNREYDLNFQRDKDEKILELSDMPIDVMKYILEYLDTFNR
ncbi:unnamed protein product [Caenorhabditis brenneri]